MRLADGDVAVRPIADEDTAEITRAARDPLVSFYTSVPENCTEEQTREWMDRGGDNFAIVDAETDQILGVVGFVVQDHDRARGHFGYWVAREARGRGVATRALRLLTRWAVEERGLARLQLIVEPENLASIRVAERVGFRREARLRSYIELRGARRDVYMYALLREDLLREG